jgi:hypothetical protein
MKTINQLLKKYENIECLFMTKEITDFKKELLDFKAEQLKMIWVLSSNEQKYKETISILENLIGKDNLKM